MADFGLLQVRATLPGRERPLAGAMVRVATAEGRVLAQAATDDSGIAPVLELPAPETEYADAAELPLPYSAYDVTVSGDAGTTVVQGAQVFAGVMSVQQVLITPGRVEPQLVSVPQPVLAGGYPPKQPEAEIKPLPPPGGLAVLPEPVVPEYVIVHAGVPTDSAAPNYWVPFKDYIKNVACCEIYASWPLSTIEANVLAILSFTLNRVYTEWYRARGYSFTITNSTAYDHAFSYGRTLFGEISLVVDELFTTYITREGIRQPLLTQYCDGKNSICPTWLSQWGSKQLGDEGYPALEILRYYYGQEVYLKQAPKVAGVPSSYPGFELTLGVTGPPVRVIQEQINTIANNYPALPRVRVDGVYDEATQNAVEKFQQIFNLPISGIVDFPTWYRLSEIYVAVTRLGELR